MDYLNVQTMRHLILKYIAKKELNERLRSSLRGYTVKFFFHILIPFTGFAQENPWTQEVTGPNPWEQTTTQQESTIQPAVTEEPIYTSDPGVNVLTTEYDETSSSESNTTPQVSQVETKNGKLGKNFASLASSFASGAGVVIYLLLTRF